MLIVEVGRVEVLVVVGRVKVVYTIMLMLHAL